MQLMLWLAACGAFAYAVRRRPLLGVVAVLVLWVLVPAIAGDVLTGRASGSLSFHPASWLILALVGVQLLTDGSRIPQVLARHVYLAITLALVIGVSVLTTRYSATSGGMSLLVDQVVAPVGLFLLVVAALEDRPEGQRLLRTVLLSLAAVTSALAVAQWVAGRGLVYEAQFGRIWWYSREGYDRWMSTFDHPLTLSLFLCVVTPLAVGLRRAWVQLAYLALVAVAVVVTQSRTGLAVIAVTIVYVVARARTGAGVKAAFLVVLGSAGAALAASSLATGVQARLADDTGSTEARADAVRFFASRWYEFAVLGKGFTASYRVSQVGGLGTSLESSVLMYAVDIGILFALLYFGAQLVMVLRAAGTVQVPGLVVAAAVAFVLPHTYSALASGSAVGALLWAVLGMTVAATDRALADRPPAGQESLPARVPAGHW